MYGTLQPTAHVERLKKRAEDILADARVDAAAQSVPAAGPADDAMHGVETIGELERDEDDEEGEGDGDVVTMEFDMAQLIPDDKAEKDDAALAYVGDESDEEAKDEEKGNDGEEWNPPVALGGIDLGPGSDIEEDDEENFYDEALEQFIPSDDEATEDDEGLPVD